MGPSRAHRRSEIRWRAKRCNVSHDHFEASIASDSKGAQQQVRKFQYLLANGGSSLTVEMKPLESSGPSKVPYELLADNYKLVRNPGRPWKLPPPIRFYAFPDEVGAYYQNAGFTSDLALELEKQLKRLQYLGPLRIYPERSYIWSGEVPEHVGWRGERAVEAMLAAASRHIGPGYRRKTQPFQAVIARWLQGLGLHKSFEVHQIAAHRKEYEVMVRAGNTRESVNLPDVGFGVDRVFASCGAVLLRESAHDDHLGTT